MPTHRLQRNWQNAGNESVSVQESISADSESNLDVEIADGSTALLINVAIDVSELKLLFISSEQALTIKTNSSNSPANTLAIAAGIPLIWTPNCGFTNPLGTDVTKLYVANSSGADVTLKMRILQDATP